jgi:hypothetical protein
MHWDFKADLFRRLQNFFFKVFNVEDLLKKHAKSGWLRKKTKYRTRAIAYLNLFACQRQPGNHEGHVPGDERLV